MDPRLLRAIFVVLLSFASISSAGCVEETDDDDDVTEQGPRSDDRSPGALAPDLRQVLFPVSRPNETHWWNDTFQAHENQNVVGGVTGEAGVDAGAYHRRDVTDLIPRNTLLQVVVEVDAELAQGDLDVWLEVPETSQSTVDAEIPYGGWSRLEYTLTRADDAAFELVVRHDEMEPTAFDYTLSMQVTAETERLPDGFAVGVSLGEDDVLEVVPEGEGATNVAVWAPDDTFLGHLPVDEGSVRIETAATHGAGNYVVLRQTGEGDARLFSSASDEVEVTFPTLRWETGEVHTADGPVTWTWTADTAPVVMGLAFRIPSPQSGDVKASVEGPDGGLLALDTEVLSIGYNRMLVTGIGAEGLLPGQYTFEVTPGQMAPTEPMEAQRITAFLAHPSSS